MPRISIENPVHITARSNNQDWFQAPLEECWKVFEETSKEVEKRFGFQTHSFVLMSNHYHWLLSLQEDNGGAGMCYFQTTTSRRIARLSNRINRIYGARYVPTDILEPRHFANAYRYVYQNPVRAGICERVEHYPWSTLNCASFKTVNCGNFGAEIPWNQLVSWLNKPINEANNERIRKALRRRTFRYPRDHRNRRSEPMV